VTVKKPLCIYGGKLKELQSGDTLPAGAAADTNTNLYVTTADVNIAANFAIYFPSEYEVGSGFVTDLADGAILEIG
jgi:hypothetical protein